MKFTTKSVSACLLASLVLTGCSGGSTGSSDSASDENTLRVGMECNYAPYNWSTTQSTDTSKKISDVDYCDGYDVMMATKLAEKTDKEVEIVKLDWDNLILSLQNDQIDGVIHEPAAETFPAAIQALQAGAVDAVTSELPVAIGVCQANPDLTYIQFEDGKGFSGAEQDAAVSIAVKKGNTTLLNALQEALDTISDDEREEMMLQAVENQPANE